MEEQNKLYFSIPDFWHRYDLNMGFLDMRDTYPEMFREDCIIDSIFGSPPCIWNGGRSNRGSTTWENVELTISNINMRGVSVRYTFNNHLINELITQDWVANLILKCTNDFNRIYNVHNGCTVATDILHNYIKLNYPNYNLAWSTTTHKLLDTDILDCVNNLTTEDIVVLPYLYNKNFEFLSQLKHPENIELLCIDEGCLDNCPYRKDHYLITDEHLCCIKPGTFSKEQFLDSNGACKHPDRTAYYYSNHYNKQYVIKYADMITIYRDLGINKFKISGRSPGWDMFINIVENYTNYFAKDEYRDEVRNMLLVDNLVGKVEKEGLIY